MASIQKPIIILFVVYFILIGFSCNSDSKKETERYRENKDKIFTGDYYIRNKADLDALKGYIGVSGTLYIESDLSSLEGLESLESIGANLNISGNDSLINLKGLNNISTIKLELIIERNPLLSSLNGLNSLKYVAGIKLYNNTHLSDIEALLGINSVEESIWIENNPYLSNLKGFDGLFKVNGSIKLTNNGLLTIKALNNLESIGGDLVIYGNDHLGSLETEVYKPPIKEPFYEGLNNLLSIGGSLEISNNEILQNLNGLNKLSSVGHLTIDNNALLMNLGVIKYKSMDRFTFEEVYKGLSRLTSVDGDVYIMDNNSLSNLEGLNNLTSIGRDLKIYDNINLTDFEKKAFNPIIDDDEIVGFNKINSVKGSIEIWGNDSLRSLKGLMRITSITGTLNIGSNTMLTSLEGLDNITSVEDLIIEWNDSLIDLVPLKNISELTGDLSIQYNPLITDLDGLNNISAVHHLYIIGNDALVDLGYLIGIDSVSGDVEITYNKSLTGLGVSICNIPGNLTITHNPLLTDEKAFEWEEAINDCGSIGGDVLIEKNNDTAFDYNYADEEEEEKPDESLPSEGLKVEVKEFSLMNINENEFNAKWNIFYHNPDYTYYQMHLYLIDKTTIGPDDWKDGQFISGEKLLSNYSMGENISGACRFTYNNIENMLYYKNNSGDQEVYIDPTKKYYLLCLGQTQVMNSDLKWSYYESYEISDSIF